MRRGQIAGRWLIGVLIGCSLPALSPCAHAGSFSISADELVELGRQLFADPSLSADGMVSCETCHQPAFAFADVTQVSLGIQNRPGTRNAPSLVGLVYDAFFWDGRAASVEELVLRPLMNPVEMGLENEQEVVERVERNAVYRQALARLFPGQPTITATQVAKALAAFVNSLKSRNSAYDLYASGKDRSALSGEALRGLEVFQGAGGCVECHRIESQGQPTFTDSAYHTTLSDPRFARQLPALAVAAMRVAPAPIEDDVRIASDPVFAELGRFVVTRNPKDIGAFRTPSLRNVARTPPYMHNGRVATLDEAVDREIYYRSLQTGRPNTLSAEERHALTAFLRALSDEEEPLR